MGCGCLQDGSPFGQFYPVGVIGDSFYLCFLWSAAGCLSLTNWYASQQSNTYNLHTATPYPSRSTDLYTSKLHDVLWLQNHTYERQLFSLNEDLVNLVK